MNISRSQIFSFWFSRSIQFSNYTTYYIWYMVLRVHNPRNIALSICTHILYVTIAESELGIEERERERKQQANWNFYLCVDISLEYISLPSILGWRDSISKVLAIEILLNIIAQSNKRTSVLYTNSNIFPPLLHWNNPARRYLELWWNYRSSMFE